MNDLAVIHSCPVWLPLTQTWLHNQVRALPKEIRSRVACIGTENPDAFACDDLHTLCGDSKLAYRAEALLRRMNTPLYPYWLARRAKEHQAKLLHSHFGNMGWMDFRVAKRLRIPQVVTFYGLDVDFLPQQDPRWQSRYRELFENVSAIFCEGSHMASRIVARGCPREKVHVHHLGVDLSGIPFRPRVRAPGEPLKVLIAGAFREKKGIPYALDALGMLRDKVDLQITVIGDAGSEPRSQQEKRSILDVIKRHGLESRVRLLGYQPHSKMFEEAYQHHLFLSPSVHAEDGDNEGGAPVSIIEMAASGMPIVSTTHCDIPGIIENGKSGFLAPERDAKALADHMEWLVNHGDQWHGMVRAARTHIEAEFDFVAQGLRLGEMYRRLVGEYAG